MRERRAPAHGARRYGGERGAPRERRFACPPAGPAAHAGKPAAPAADPRTAVIAFS
ncbi:hypothetical protein BTH_I0167 [Burkholderia thailandensis E264]|uniref:Uncharacterized protein n=1 Tax=Burkholderia thailandensis (strain ATCC 700388 / DSM 13276 / CCUG 48851 / CIP 106301 / E264) TaxID=271848 RepID=Q2T274_BURTA|nr:hypothetical protein BTH_I0167 [Burkholderia thailandensis E264]